MTEPAASPGAPAPPDDLRATIDAVVAGWSEDPRLAHVRRLAARPARLGVTARPLAEPLASRVPHRTLWSHQARALDLVRAGTSVALATGTASGKSLCYQIPAAEAALDGGTALLVFPTKALAQDQLQSFAAWDVPGVVPATYDGDCTPEERTWVRGNANVLLTNPEMLHQGILPNHGRWAPFLHRLRLLVVDELHVLRGIFGTHTAQVLRRLRRLAEHYGAEPHFVFTSATIGDPAGLASELCGMPVEPVTADGAPSGDRTVVLWNPDAGSMAASRAERDVPLPPENDDGGLDGPDDDDGPARVDRRWSVHGEAALVASRLIDRGLRTLVFCRSRRSTELVAADIRRMVRPEHAGAVRSYRAGYLAEERREIEAELFGGRLRGVVATNALELGVDIGGLDAVVLCGYPGTIASFWQQVGRGGRSQEPSLAVVVAGQDQLDQWMMRHPDELFGRAPEPAVINPDNPYVYVPHLACAAHERPLSRADESLWPDQLDDGVRRLVLDDRATVRRRKGQRVAVWSGRGLPAPTIGIRSASRGEVSIRDPHDEVIGTVDESRAYQAVHPGAVYLHQGRPWRVLDLDLDAHTATVEPADGATYTQTRSTTSIQVLGTDRSKPVGSSRLALGTVEVTSQVVGYQTRSTRTHEVLDRTTLDLPAQHLSTRAVWYVFPDSVVDAAGVTAGALPGALHAAEHAAIGILPLFTICDRWDVGGVSTAFLIDTGGPTVVIHDAHPGGAGIAELAFDASDRHLAATLDVLSNCGCADGCPSCVQSPKCGNGNEPLDKDAAARLVRATLATPAHHAPSIAS
jgi:DEAD/DEAH box helicase domain-containing protein